MLCAGGKKCELQFGGGVDLGARTGSHTMGGRDFQHELAAHLQHFVESSEPSALESMYSGPQSTSILYSEYLSLTRQPQSTLREKPALLRPDWWSGEVETEDCAHEMFVNAQTTKPEGSLV